MKTANNGTMQSRLIQHKGIVFYTAAHDKLACAE